jgi:hypothetical protein
MKLLGLLTIVFITLKLTKVIAWSWWLVLMPVWVGWPICFGLLMLLAALIAWAETK